MFKRRPLSIILISIVDFFIGVGLFVFLVRRVVHLIYTGIASFFSGSMGVILFIALLVIATVICASFVLLAVLTFTFSPYFRTDNIYVAVVGLLLTLTFLVITLRVNPSMAKLLPLAGETLLALYFSWELIYLTRPVIKKQYS
jgi:hypothetical protein